MLYLYTVFVMMEVNMYWCKSNSCETQQVFIHVYIAKIPYIYYSHIYTCKIWKKLLKNGVLYCRGISESNIYAWLTMHCITMVHSVSYNKQHFIRFWLLDSHASIMIYNFKLCQYFDSIFKIMNIHTYTVLFHSKSFSHWSL